MKTAIRRSRCFVSPPIGQALAGDPLERGGSAFGIRESKFLAVGVAKIKLMQVTL